MRWGVSDPISGLPDLSERALVENDTKVQCFDAVWLRASMLVMIDCVQNGTFGLQNYFYYVNATTKTTIGKVKNDMYVAFTVMRARKIRLHYENQYVYLIRSYFANAVDPLHRDNTYAEIISLQNPMKPWTVRVMDRSFLHQNRLAITDF